MELQVIPGDCGDSIHGEIHPQVDTGMANLLPVTPGMAGGTANLNCLGIPQLGHFCCLSNMS